MSGVDGHISYISVGDNTYDVNGNTMTNNLVAGTLNFQHLFRNLVLQGTDTDEPYTSQACAVRLDSAGYPHFYQFYATYEEEDCVMARFNYNGSDMDTVVLSVDGHCNGACYDATNDAILVASNNKIYVITDYDDSVPTVTSTNFAYINSSSAVYITPSSIAYDRSNAYVYCSVRNGETITMYAAPASTYATDGLYEASVAFSVTTPAEETGYSTEYYAYVRQGMCGYNGMIGLLWWHPDLITWYDAFTGDFICSTNIPVVCGYNIPVGEVEDIEVMENGDIYLSSYRKMVAYIGSYISKSNVVTNYNYGGEMTNASVGLTVQEYVSSSADFCGYADGSAEYPFRLAQEAVAVAETNTTMKWQIVTADTTQTSTGALGTVSIRKSNSVVFGTGSGIMLDIGDIYMLDGTARFQNCTFTPLGIEDYPIYIAGSSNAYFNECTLNSGDTNDAAYYGRVTGSSRVTFKGCTFNFDPDTVGQIYCSAVPGIEAWNNTYSNDDDYDYAQTWYLNGGALNVYTPQVVSRRVTGDGYLRGALSNSATSSRFIGGYGDMLLVPATGLTAGTDSSYSISSLTQVTTLDLSDVSEMYDNARAIWLAVFPLTWCENSDGWGYNTSGSYTDGDVGRINYVKVYLNGVTQQYFYNTLPGSVTLDNGNIFSFNDQLTYVVHHDTSSHTIYLDNTYDYLGWCCSAISSDGADTGGKITTNVYNLANVYNEDRTFSIALSTGSIESITIPRIQLGIRPLGLEF